jgi:lipid A disaccharide synthetase
MQDMIAVISLRSEDEISIESLTEDLKSVLNYPLNADQMVRNLQHLRRSGLISVDWQGRTIKREKALREYIKKNVIASETLPAVSADWRRISMLIQNKHKTVNNEYQNYI